MLKRIVIIGGGTAGASAAFSARKHDRSAEITVIDKEPYSTYSRCGLPFAIKGIINPIENLVVFAPKVFASQKITQKLSTEVIGINHQTHEVVYRNIVTGETGKVNYDSLIFATGSTPLETIGNTNKNNLNSRSTLPDVSSCETERSRHRRDLSLTGSTASRPEWLGQVGKPPIAGIDGKNVFVLRSIDDAKNIIQSAKSVKSVVIVGASFIGLEVAEALKYHGLDVTVIEQKYLLWRMLDKEISQMARQRLLNDGGPDIRRDLTGCNVPIGLTASKKGIKLIEDKTISNLAEYKDSMVIISTGVRPSVKLAQDMGVEIGVTGGIKVDQNLRTNLADVYAVGDCAEGVSGLTGQPIVIGLGTIAARQGVVAGANAAGANQTAPIILNASVLKLLDMEIGSVGVTEGELSRRGGTNCGFNPISALIKYPSLPHYYPGGTDVHIKLIADRETRRIIGGQVLCKNEAALRVDMISLTIQNKMTVNDILKSDFCYSPPVTDVWEPIMIAAQAVAARLNRA